MSSQPRPTLSPVIQEDALFGRPLPPGYRDELQALVAEPPARVVRQTGSTLLFQLGGQRLALPTRVASAIAPVLHIARIPHRSGTVLLGLCAFRGDLLPCCSLARLLDLPMVQAGHGRTLILEESPGRRWAVPIEGVLGIQVITRHTVAVSAPGTAPPTPPFATHWVRESFPDDSGGFHLLDHDVLFRQITLATA